MTDHPIPDAALDADIATLAKKGAGKTYLNKGLVERLLDMKRRVVVLDPLSVWWGLKALADGSPGYPVVVVGGPHADVDLDPKMGAELAAYVAHADVRMVIDVSELRAGALVSFSAAFLGELYRVNRDPLWLVLEEADVFAPQNPQANETMMLHEVDMIARRGRQRGFRLWTICQRPQEINKKTLSQTTTMVLMRLMSPQDREAAKKWLLAHGTKDQADQILTQLPSLAVGEGYVLAPELDLLERAKFPPIRTLDNSATPKAGERRVGVKALAKVEVGALRAALASPTPEPPAPARGSADFSPGADVLSAELAALRRQYEEDVSAARDAGRRDGFHAACTGAMKLVEERLTPFLDELREVLAIAEAGFIASEPTPPVQARPAKRQPATEASTATPAVKQSPSGRGGIPAPQQRVLNALAWWRQFGIEDPTSEQVAFVAGYSPSSSGFQNLKGAMRSAGLITYPAPGKVAITGDGIDFAEWAEGEITRNAFHDAVKAKLSGPQKRILEPLLAAYPRHLDSAALAAAADYSPTSSGFQNLRGQMRTLGFLDYPAPGQVRASDWLFP